MVEIFIRATIQSMCVVHIYFSLTQLRYVFKIRALLLHRNFLSMPGHFFRPIYTIPVPVDLT